MQGHVGALEAGQRAQWCFYVVEGLVREYYIDEQGEEHTRAFADAGRFTGSLLDLLSGEPSVTWVQELEPTMPSSPKLMASEPHLYIPRTSAGASATSRMA